MPGAGVRSSNIKKLVEESGAYEYHTSARKIVPNPMLHSNPAVLDSGNVYMADVEELKTILAIMQ